MDLARVPSGEGSYGAAVSPSGASFASIPARAEEWARGTSFEWRNGGVSQKKIPSYLASIHMPLAHQRLGSSHCVVPVTRFT